MTAATKAALASDAERSRWARVSLLTEARALQRLDLLGRVVAQSVDAKVDQHMRARWPVGDAFDRNGSQPPSRFRCHLRHVAYFFDPHSARFDLDDNAVTRRGQVRERPRLGFEYQHTAGRGRRVIDLGLVDQPHGTAR
jgi:hypothetical protein